MPVCLEHGRSYAATGTCGTCGFLLCNHPDHSYSAPGPDEPITTCSACKYLHKHAESTQKQLDLIIILSFGTLGLLVFVLAFRSLLSVPLVLLLLLVDLLVAGLFIHSLLRWNSGRKLNAEELRQEFAGFLEPFSPVEDWEYYQLRLKSMPVEDKEESESSQRAVKPPSGSLSSLVPTQSAWQAIWDPLEKVLKKTIEQLENAPLEEQLEAHLALVENFTEIDPSTLLNLSEKLDRAKVDPMIAKRFVTFLYRLGDWRTAWAWEQQGIKDVPSRCAFVETVIRESWFAEAEFRELIQTLAAAPQEFEQLLTHLGASTDSQILSTAVNIFVDLELHNADLLLPAFRTLIRKRDLDSIREVLKTNLDSETKESLILELFDEQLLAEIPLGILTEVLGHSQSDRVLTRFEKYVSQWHDLPFLENALTVFAEQPLPESTQKIASRLVLAQAYHFLETGESPEANETIQQSIDEYADKVALKTIDALYQAQSFEKRGETESALSCYENILSFGTLPNDQVQQKMLSLERLEYELSTIEKVLKRTASGIPIAPEKIASLTGIDSDVCRTHLLAYQSRWEALGSYLEYEDVFFKPTVAVGPVSPQTEAVSPTARSSAITCASCGAEIDKNAQCQACDFQNTSCEICRGPVSYGQEVALCPFCEATFHAEHLREWLRVKGACPMCKNTLKEKYYIQLETISADIPQAPDVVESHPKRAFIDDITIQIGNAEQTPDPAGTILLCGRILEGIIQELYEDREGAREKRKGTLHSMTKRLVKKGIIPPHIHVWAGTIRLHRNRIAHELSKPSPADGQLIVGSIRAILDWYVEETANEAG